jgi:hypothetical protein
LCADKNKIKLLLSIDKSKVKIRGSIEEPKGVLGLKKDKKEKDKSSFLSDEEKKK